MLGRVARFRKPALAWLGVSAALLAHGLAAVIYMTSAGSMPVEERIQFLTLLGALTVLAGGMFAVESRLSFRLLLILRVMLWFALGYRFRALVEPRLLIATALLFEIGIYERFPVNLAIQATILAAGTTLFDLLGPLRAPAASVGLVALLPALAGGSAAAITRFRERWLATARRVVRQDQAIGELSQSNVALQQHAFRAEEQSRLVERQRIAREVHDTVGYTLTNLLMMMEAASDLLLQNQTRRTEELLAEARRQATMGLEETRRALRELRHDIEPLPTGIRAIARLVKGYDQTGVVQVDVDYGNAAPTFGDEVDSCVYHFVQEALTNALRHGHADVIAVRFWVSDSHLQVWVSDNGSAGDAGGGSDGDGSKWPRAVTDGIGFSGMRERLAQLGGELAAGHTPAGFRVQILIPVQQVGQDQSLAG